MISLCSHGSFVQTKSYKLTPLNYKTLSREAIHLLVCFADCCFHPRAVLLLILIAHIVEHTFYRMVLFFGPELVVLSRSVNPPKFITVHKLHPQMHNRESGTKFC